MVSHFTASLRLTGWHEGTFASSVIYSSDFPILSPFLPLPLSLALFFLHPSHSRCKMTFIILSLSRSHYFPAARDRREQVKGGNEAQTGQIAARSGSSEENGALLSVTQGPGGKWQHAAQWKPRRYRLSGEIRLHGRGAAARVTAKAEIVGRMVCKDFHQL